VHALSLFLFFHSWIRNVEHFHLKVASSHVGVASICNCLKGERFWRTCGWNNFPFLRLSFGADKVFTRVTTACSTWPGSWGEISARTKPLPNWQTSTNTPLPSRSQTVDADPRWGVKVIFRDPTRYWKYWIVKSVFKTLKKYWICPKYALSIEKVWKF